MEKVSFGSGGGAPGAHIQDPQARYIQGLLTQGHTAGLRGGMDSYHGGSHGQKKPNPLANLVAMGLAGFAAWRFGLFGKLANTKLLKNLHLEKHFATAKNWISKNIGGLFKKGAEGAAKSATK